MTTGAMTAHRPSVAARQESFWHLVHAEWTKFRSVRGWVIAMLVAIGAISAFVFVATSVSRSCGTPSGFTSSGATEVTLSACPPPPTGPGSEPVTDAFYFAHQSLAGNGTITVQLTSLTGQVEVSQASNGRPVLAPGLQPWSKAGIIIKQNTTQGSAYAAMMVTGSSGVRMQWDYVNDTPGLTGSVSATSPRWLRLVRDGSTITGYDSADGTHWTKVATATLEGLTSTVQAGLFAADPGNASTGSSGVSTGVFRHIGLSWPTVGWTGTNVGGSGPNGTPLPGKMRGSAGMLAVTGSGDIAPLAGNLTVLSVQRALTGTFIGLIPLMVVGAMFVTSEYRRGLIRVSLAASPRRGRLLAAKAVVLATVSFVTGLIAATVAVVIGTRRLGRTGIPLWPVPPLTEVRLVVGTAVLLAVAAVLALAIGTILRRSAPAITAAIVLIFVPYLLATKQTQQAGPSAWGESLLRITPAAAFSVQQAVPQFSQVTAIYTPTGGYYPLAPWAGIAVECAWAAAALALALLLLRRRDA
jgi:ABC-type transport system involved in multi-copper enzyme maturation permease subunit